MFVIVRHDALMTGREWFDGTVFTGDRRLAYICLSLSEARRLQGMLQSQFPGHEVSKVPVVDEAAAV